MPVASLPDVLRRRLSPIEQNVLLLASRGGAKMVTAELGARESGGVRSVEEAEKLIADTRAKAARILGETTNGNGNGRAAGMAVCGQHGEFTDRGRGCPACNPSQGGGGRPKPAGDAPKPRREALPPMPPSAPRRPARRARAEQRERTAAGERDAELRRAALEAAGVGEDDDERAFPVSSGEDGTLQIGEAAGEPDTASADAEPPPAPPTASPDSFEPPPPAPADASADPLSPVPAPADDEASRQRSRADIERDRARLLVLLADGPKSQHALALALGVSRSQVQNDLRRIATDGDVTKTGRYVFDWPRDADAMGRASTQWQVTPGAPVAHAEALAAGDDVQVDDEKGDGDADARGLVAGGDGGGGDVAADAVSDGEPAQPAASGDGGGPDAAPAVERDEEEAEAAPAPVEDPRKVVLLRRLQRRREAAEREQAQLAGELRELADEMLATLDAEVPETLLRGRYLAALLKRIEKGDTAPELLDRFERLAGLSE